MENKKYTKLSALVDDTFTVEKAYGFTWKKWDAESKRMLTSERYEQGFRKIYSIVTDKGQLDLGPGQLSSLLEAVYKNGQADINNRTFAVKSNGKTGMDIRYFFNAVKQESKKVVDEVFNADDPINLEDIPFN